MNENKSIFETLFEVNVNDQVEKKNGLSYLPWAYAWGEVKKLYPEANYKVYSGEPAGLKTGQRLHAYDSAFSI